VIVVLKIYARHVAACPQKASDYRKCRCPKWIMGALPTGEFVRESTKQTSWERAERIAQSRWDASLPGAPQPVTLRKELSKAIDEYLNDLEAQGLSANTYRDRKVLLRSQLLPWCQREGLKYLDEFTTEMAKRFRTHLREIGNSGTTMAKKHAGLVTFFHVCVNSGLLYEHPISRKLKRPKPDSKPTEWLTPEEYAQVLNAAENYEIKGIDYRDRSERAQLLIEIMRWAGLALGDAVMLERSRIDDKGRLFLYRGKTGVPVLVQLPPKLVARLKALPCPNPLFFFWTGSGTKKSATSAWDRTLRKIFKRSGVEKRIHAHMLRDTFAVSLLLAGVPLDQVALLLGHSSTKTTEKHYAPFVAARQEQLLQAVQQMWLHSAYVPAPEPQPMQESESSRMPVSVHRRRLYSRGRARPVHHGIAE
jgi:integrase/recombinase XerD